LGHIIMVSTISANGCQLTAATRTGLPNASLRLETWLDEGLRADNGLTLTDYHLLLLLAEAPRHRLRMSELADRMVFSRSRITYRVSSTTKRGLAVREPDPDDGRGSRAVLTAAGLETLRRATPGHAASVRKLFFGSINDDDLACVEGVFTRLRESLQRNGRETT
jgi:DNA-binding MarR family transcriptional regulator